MIHICITAHNDATTIGLVLWKVRQVFTTIPREYQFIVLDDASTDNTAEVLESYQRALPLTLIRHEQHRGYAASLEALLRDALRRSDRPKRDFAVTLRPDFSLSPAVLPDLVRAMESGADLVVAESPDEEPSMVRRLVRRIAPWLLQPGVRVPGVRDLLSRVCALRLSTLAFCLRNTPNEFLASQGVTASAELIARAASVARQISAVAVDVPAGSSLAAPPDYSALALALELFRTGRRLRVPPPTVDVRRAS